MKRILLVAALLLLCPVAAQAQGMPSISFGVTEADSPQEVATALRILFVFTVLSVAPTILLMTTSFTRIVIVLGFVRNAMGTQQAPPNQVILGLALFLTFFIMAPVFNQINNDALQPYLNEEIAFDSAVERAVVPMREFMFSQVSESDLGLLVSISGNDQPETRDDIPTLTLIPAFMLSELKRAFQIGFLVYIPFLVIDMVIASVLMGMGMMMLPPIIISLPFKLLLFVLVDGWELVIGSLVRSFG
ncbi:MAG: flagellar type III secretion system pore protein FliP [Geoalkalibacter sp.]|uniref:flagellar type III secretion system pore protein FliP n=1 Tax=Geoalkalibacter sp. TaxID=3041440 RepID=UPI002A9F8321|nr:flagellar type III secretion system pore protein FliP [Thermodesulfobacteriota bacterium]